MVLTTEGAPQGQHGSPVAALIKKPPPLRSPRSQLKPPSDRMSSGVQGDAVARDRHPGQSSRRADPTTHRSQPPSHQIPIDDISPLCTVRAARPAALAPQPQRGIGASWWNVSSLRHGGFRSWC